jgi:hypothetical protein
MFLELLLMLMGLAYMLQEWSYQQLPTPPELLFAFEFLVPSK